MELSSFKSILLRKADGNKNISQLLNNMPVEDFVDDVVEALEKMALSSNNTGKKANPPLTSFGQDSDSTDLGMMRDALGHHLSHYKAALKAHHAAPEGSPEKVKFRQVADQHMDHLFPLMHLAARAEKHSNGKFVLDYPDIPPWETNYSKLDRNAKGDGPQTDPKLLRSRTKKTGSIDKTHPNWHFLEMPPHPGHAANATMPHTSGYPWEEIQLGTPADRDAKKAYLHIEDVPAQNQFTPHEFDSHPIRAVQDISPKYMSDETRDKYAADMAKWRDSEPFNKWMERHGQLAEADEAGYEARGSKKPAHFYEGIPLQKHPDHVHKHPVVQKKQPVSAQAQGAAGAATPPVVRPGVKPKKAERSLEEVAANPSPEDNERAYQGWKLMPKHVQDTILKAHPKLAEYIASKGGK